jgi:HK97 family phage prohead protease
MTASKATDGTTKQGMTLKGYPITWNQTSSDRGGYSVRLVPGSAKFTTPALALYRHDFSQVIGNTANGTLRIMEADETGIPVEIDLPDTTTGNDVAELVAKGYISGMSFSMVNGFENSFTTKENDTEIVNCTSFTVDEVTVCADPAFSSTTIEVADEDGEDDVEQEHDAADVAPERIAASQKLLASRLHMMSMNL